MDSSPQVSPDGRKIAFVSDRSGFEEVWTVDADGENATEVTRLRAQGLGSPRWSPDSRQLAFDAMGSDGRAIFLVDTSGGAPRKWSQSGSAGRPSWSRDGQWIYFGDADAARDKQIFRMSARDPERRVQMTHDGAFEGFESADGKSLFYLHGHELRRMPAGGGEPSPVTDRMLAMGLWSVAENGVYFVDLASARTSGNLARGEKPVQLLDPASGAVRRVGAIGGDMFMNLPDFSVSPDGKALYYSILEVSVSQIRMIEGGF
jgi:dipeptidyl aminopeptidase/acylaminoacyl peptidase